MPSGRFLGRAKPSSSAASIHSDPWVKSLPRHVVNPLSVAIDIALNDASGDGATAVAERGTNIDWALSGMLKAPKITVLLVR